MIKTDFLRTKQLPLVVTAENASQTNLRGLIDLCQNKLACFETQLFEFGALLFRGFRISEAKDLEQFARFFSNSNLWNYRGGASPRRREIKGDVYTSTEYPPHLTLALHNELSYSEKYPRQLYFCCATAAENGGATTLGDSRQILKSLAPEIVDEFRRKKVMYIRNLQADIGSGYSWQDAFETNNRAIVEDHCNKIGARFEWKASGILHLEQVRPATTIHPVTHEEVWFNQASGFHPSELDLETYQILIAQMSEDEFRLNARFGDGSPLNVEMLKQIREVLRCEIVPINWQEGDVLIVDNILAAHGRLPFAGKRKILLAMT